MTKITRFEDLKCWKEARILVGEVYHLFKTDTLKNEFVLRDQCQRAAISIMTNIAEGFSRFSRKDFIRFLDYSQSSAAELRSLLYVVKDMGSMDTSVIQERTDKVKALVLGLVKHLKSNPAPKNTISEPQESFYLVDTNDEI